LHRFTRDCEELGTQEREWTTVYDIVGRSGEEGGGEGRSEGVRARGRPKKDCRERGKKQGRPGGRLGNVAKAAAQNRESVGRKM